ncbi:MAG: hypothetical protein GY918_13900, partial [Gammaproteobacteria bacterium]|nr:hypothetical protein [Gammaproteobacteria bacterium]
IREVLLISPREQGGAADNNKQQIKAGINAITDTKAEETTTEDVTNKNQPAAEAATENATSTSEEAF